MPLVVPVKFTYASKDLWFDPQGLDIIEGDYAICKTERGTEIGLVTRDPFDAPEEELAAPLKPVLRIATDEDLDRADELARKGDEAMHDFRRLVKKNELDMKPVGVEYLFGGEKLVFYFAAEDRVDFRQLVRDLSSCFHTRVDMRQIGVRDETRLVGGYAPCGQELCCARFGGNFEPVSIRMAKEQDLPLNSSKISGMCGRLMCCLRYEFEAYKDFKGRAPKKKAVIDTPLGKARIVEYNTPREQLTLRLENGKAFTVDLADMTCSDEAQKRADEQGYTCRPDCVTRDVLEKIDSPEMRMALVELDRKNGVDVGDGLDSADRIEADSAQQRQRSPRGGQQGGGQGSQSGSGASSNRSNRSRGSRNGQQNQGQSQNQGQGQGGRSSNRGQGQRQNQGQGQRQGQGQGGSNQGDAAASHRRRRHSSASTTSNQAQGGQQQASRQQQSGQQQSQGSQSSSSRRRRQHVSATEGQASGVAREQHAEGTSGASTVTTTGSRPRRHTTASSGGNSSSRGSSQQGGSSSSGKPNVPSVADQLSEGSVEVTRRHPGDGGGQKAASGGSSGSGSNGSTQKQGSSQRGQASQQGQQNQGGQQGQASQDGQQAQKRRRRRSRKPRTEGEGGNGQVGGSSSDGGGSQAGGNEGKGAGQAQGGAGQGAGKAGSQAGGGAAAGSGSPSPAPSSGSDGNAPSSSSGTPASQE